jgi:hypothetical protein
VAVWYQGAGGLNSVWANRYVAPDALPPELLLDAPSEGTHTSAPSVRVTGHTESGASVEVNGVRAAVGAQGAFDLLVPLDPGPNAVVVEARDAAGNRATLAVNVTYDDPVATLEAQVAQAQDEAASAQAVANATQAEINVTRAEAEAASELSNATQAALDSALSRLVATEAAAASAKRESNETRGELDTAWDQVITDSVRIAVLEGDLANARRDLDEAQGRVGSLETLAGAGAAMAGAALVAAAGLLAFVVVRARRDRRGA